MIMPDGLEKAKLEGENSLVLNRKTVMNIIALWMSKTMFDDGVKIVSIEKKYNDFEIKFTGPEGGDETNDQ